MDALRTAGARLCRCSAICAGNRGNAAAGLLRDALDGLGNFAILSFECLLLLDVQILGVLAHNNHVDLPGVGPDRLDGPHICVQIHLLTEADDRGRVALDWRRWGADSAEQSAIAVGAENLNGLVGESLAMLLERAESGFKVEELELQAEGGRERLEDSPAGRDDLLAYAIARNEALGEQSQLVEQWNSVSRAANLRAEAC